MNTWTPPSSSVALISNLSRASVISTTGDRSPPFSPGREVSATTSDEAATAPTNAAATAPTRNELDTFMALSHLVRISHALPRVANPA